MNLSVKYNGVELGDYIDILHGYTQLIGADWSPEIVKKGGVNDGSDFQYTSYTSKTVKTPFTITGDLKEKYDLLEKALSVSEPKELIFGDAPERCFHAIPNGNLDFDDFECFGEGEITWTIPDGISHSVVQKSFSAEENSDGVLEATIANAGTASVPVDYEITHNHENGFIGIVSEYGVIQLGKVEELDTETRQKSQVLFRYNNPTDFGNMTDGAGIFDANHSYPRNGSFGSRTVNGKPWLYLSNVGSGATWHGAIRQLTLPADSSGAVGAKNFHAQALLWFETSKVQQTGAIEYVIGGADGKHLASIHIVKSSTTSNIATFVMQINGVEVGRTTYEPHWQSALARGGVVYIKKSGELFEFYFAGKKYQYRNASMKEKKATTVSVAAMQYSNRGAGNLISHMYFGYAYLQKDNVDYEYDIPNRYRQGSKVYINGETTKVYVDGIPSQGDEIRGSKYFLVPPGETKVQFYHSEFSSPPPTITAKIREAYL